MCRHFDVDTILEGDMEARKNLSAYCSLRQSNAESTANHVRIGGDEEDSDHTAASKKLQPYKEDVFQVLSFFSRNRDGAIRMKALNALGRLYGHDSPSGGGARNMRLGIVGQICMLSGRVSALEHLFNECTTFTE